MKVENKLNLKDKIINKMREMVNVDKKEKNLNGTQFAA